MLIDRKVLNKILELDDQNPYFRGLVAQSGIKADFVDYTWVKRKMGKSKMSPLILIDTAINGLVTTSRLPARFALLSGFFISAIGISIGIFTIIEMAFFQTQISRGIPTIIVAVFLLGGVQLFFLGLIGEYVLSIHSQVKREPQTFSIEQINFK
jgi:hypothetical protein